MRPLAASVLARQEFSADGVTVASPDSTPSARLAAQVCVGILSTACIGDKGQGHLIKLIRVNEFCLITHYFTMDSN